jgi:hypothetical protein
MQPFNWASAKVLVIAVLMIVFNLLIPKIEPLLLDIAIRSASITIVYSLLIFYSRATPDGNAFLLKQINRFRPGKKS